MMKNKYEAIEEKAEMKTFNKLRINILYFIILKNKNNKLSKF
jgi:hypothetical protein